jgi:hypothetical protein
MLPISSSSILFNCNRVGRERYLQSMHEYLEIVHYEGEQLPFFGNLATYHGRVLNAQYLTNVQEHFVQMLKKYCNFMVITRLKDQVPQGLTEAQLLQNLKQCALKVKNCCLSGLLNEGLQVYQGMEEHDRGIVNDIWDILPFLFAFMQTEFYTIWLPDLQNTLNHIIN